MVGGKTPAERDPKAFALLGPSHATHLDAGEAFEVDGSPCDGPVAWICRKPAADELGILDRMLSGFTAAG